MAINKKVYKDRVNNYLFDIILIQSIKRWNTRDGKGD